MKLTLRTHNEGGATVVSLINDSIGRQSIELFSCSVSINGKEFHANILSSELQDLLILVNSATIPVFGDCPVGIGGTSYELTIESTFASSTYRWWMTPAKKWHPLSLIADKLYHLAFHVSGQY